MNEKANELGCQNTHFTNPDGLHDAEHYTTARDLYLISKYALTLPYFEQISNATEYTIAGDEEPLVTTNYLIDKDRGGDYYYSYARGIKTGTTDEAGRCLVTTASADGHSYIAVLLGAPLKDTKKKTQGEDTGEAQGEQAEEEEYEDEEYFTFIDAADLFRWALVDLEMQTIKSADTPVCESKVKLAWGRDKITLVPQKNLNAIMPKDLKQSNIVVETDVPEELRAPLSPDEPVGTASVYYVEDGKEKQLVATADLVPTEKWTVAEYSLCSMSSAQYSNPTGSSLSSVS
jgi:D-alanyl-D-alanine carboxypeptidase (penicillin-binding protein 5/6)